MEGNTRCIFCLIVEGKAPSYKVYEDDLVIAILDINPATPGHTLIISKKHYDTLEKMPSELVSHMFKVANEMAIKIKRRLGGDGYNLLANVGRWAGQVIFHSHIHIVPRYKNDGIRFIANQKRASEEELRQVFEKIVKGDSI